MADNGYSKNETFGCGLIGVICYACVMLPLCLWALKWTWHTGKKKKYTRNIFALVCVFYLLDIPRYCVMVATKEYYDQFVFSLHLWANAFFFWAFTQCLEMFAYIMNSGALPILGADMSFHANLGAYCRFLIFNPFTLRIMVTLLFIVTLISSIYCNKEESLEDYFRSGAYVGWLVIENICDGASLLAFIFYGYSLRLRIMAIAGVIPTETGTVAILRRSVDKMMVVLICSVIGFICRMVFCVIQIDFYSSQMAGSVSNETPDYNIYVFYIFGNYMPHIMVTISFLMLIVGPSSVKMYSSKDDDLISDASSDRATMDSTRGINPLHSNEKSSPNRKTDTSTDSYRNSTISRVSYISTPYQAWEDVVEQDIEKRKARKSGIDDMSL